MFGIGLAELLLVAAVVIVTALAVLALMLLLRRRPDAADDSGLPEDLAGLRREVASLRAEARGALRRQAVVRYDAFGDMGGRLSWSLALADDGGHGVVLTSIHGRSDARTYAKGLSAWTSEQPLSPEEEQAIAQARAS